MPMITYLILLYFPDIKSSFKLMYLRPAWSSNKGLA